MQASDGHRWSAGTRRCRGWRGRRHHYRVRDDAFRHDQDTDAVIPKNWWSSTWDLGSVRNDDTTIWDPMSMEGNYAEANSIERGSSNATEKENKTTNGRVC